MTERILRRCDVFMCQERTEDVVNLMWKQCIRCGPRGHVAVAETFCLARVDVLLLASKQ
jgi:hypothetical protein